MGSVAMDSVSMNHYEKQLYTVFKTFDVDNEEALNKSAVLELCDALQLEDRGAALVDTLFERRTDRVTFTQFRNGLLSVLGAAAPSAAAAAPSVDCPSTAPAAATATAAAAAAPSDDDSSGREVAPKFVFGSKKYGRRSRPHRSPATPDESPSPRAASVSRLDTDNKRARNFQRMKYRRSISAVDTRHGNSQANDENDVSPDRFDHDRRVDTEEALALCHGLRMDGIDRRLVEHIFEESPTGDMTVGEFFDRLNSSLTSSLERTQNEDMVTRGDIDDVTDDESGTGVASALIIDAWENAGVPQPRRLLMELGFSTAAFSPLELERALDEELRAYGEPLEESRDTRILFLLAALELSRFRLKRARKRAEVASAERDKLRNDVVEANRRARVLAQDNDESHARLEAELAASVRRADARLADAARLAAADVAAERERAAAARAQLDAELAQRSVAERSLREQIHTLNERLVELESRASEAAARAAAAERSAADACAARRAAAADDDADRAACERLSLLTDQLTELRRENEQLRDRNDELCSALERRAPPSAPAGSAAGGDLSAELAALLPAADTPEESDSAPTSIDHRTASCVEVARCLRTLAAAAPAPPAVCVECSARDQTSAALYGQLRDLADELDRAPARQHDVGAERGPDELGEVEELRRELAEAERRHDDEKLKLSELARELEASLEQMKAEYDKCEEYWSSKLEEEREAFNEEQRLGDRRLAELAAEIREYERQFAGSARALPPIEERAALEAQVTDLEAEFAAHRALAAAELRARDERLARLAARLAAREPCACAALASRCARLAAAGGAGAREAAGLRARATRAEAAVRRLHARLAAADLLVKDLYVENCQLAHRRPL